MTEAALELMQAITRGIHLDEACADQMGALAAEAKVDGDDLVAKGFSALARNHRIRALELRGMLAAVSSAFGGIFHQDL